jgi:hypothetical protein
LSDFLEHLDERTTDDLPLLFRLPDALEPAQEKRRRVDHPQIDVEMIAVEPLDRLALAFRSRPLSTKHTVSCRPIALCSSAAATEESTPPDRPSSTRPLPDPRADVLDRMRDEVARRPLLLHAADAEQEIPDDVHAALGVKHLGVKLDAIDTPLRVLDRRVGEFSVVPIARKPGGSFVSLSPCEFQTRSFFGSPANSRPGF